MEGLRLILLVLGALVIGGVYVHSRWGNERRRKRFTDVGGDDDGRHVMHARDHDEDLPEDLPPLRATEDESEEAAGTTPSPRVDNDDGGRQDARHEKIIVLNILPADVAEKIPGADLLDVFDRAGLEYGQFGVFHRIKETADGPKSVFSVASATEPGSFDITTMAEESYRGLSLFMLLPGPLRGVDAFADMLATARRIAEQIRGEVLDHDRSTLTRQTAHHIREDIIAFEHRLQITG